MRIFQSGAVLLLAGLLMLCGNTPARADAAPKPQQGHDDHDHAKPKAGDAKHDDAKKDDHAKGDSHAHGPFDFALEESIWTILVFVLLLIILRMFAWKPILEGLRKREEHIRLAVEEAKLARQETERVRTEFRAEMDKAYAEIPKIMEDARRDAAALRDEMRSKSAADIATDRDRLRREIETARDQALQELWNQTATLATLISAKAIGRSLNAEDHRRLTEEALNEVKDAGNKWQTELRQFGAEWTRKGGGE